MHCYASLNLVNIYLWSLQRYDSVAQLVEQRPFKPWVESSNLSRVIGWFGSIHPELINKTTEAFEKQKG